MFDTQRNSNRGWLEASGSGNIDQTMAKVGGPCPQPQKQTAKQSGEGSIGRVWKDGGSWKREQGSVAMMMTSVGTPVEGNEWQMRKNVWSKASPRVVSVW